MIRVDGFYLYTVGFSIHPLTEISAGATFGDSLPALYIGQTSVEQLFNQSVYRPKIARAAAEELYGVLKALTEKMERTEPLNHYEVYQISSLAAKLEHVLAAEFGMMDIYLVSKKRGYDTSELITNGTALFPDEIKLKVPESTFDIEQGARCLAFELSTSAAFHFHRANESVLHRYYDAVTGQAPRPTGRNIGDYLNELDKRKVGDDKVKSALRDLKDLHRNPLIHPDESVDSVDDAVALLGSIQAAIVQMLKAIPIPVPTSPPTIASAAAATP